MHRMHACFLVIMEVKHFGVASMKVMVTDNIRVIRLNYWESWPMRESWPLNPKGLLSFQIGVRCRVSLIQPRRHKRKWIPYLRQLQTQKRHPVQGVAVILKHQA